MLPNGCTKLDGKTTPISCVSITVQRWAKIGDGGLSIAGVTVVRTTGSTSKSTLLNTNSTNMISILISHEDDTYKEACQLANKWAKENLIPNYNLEEIGITIRFYSEFDKELFKATL